ncbi:hypothetical protein VFPPC_15068 [Pochonia chlamydosporia 170]|uniref:Uncharacterized protein n=1 Tax=Pochonia chlamydosporia 170 TaxID=1380566 RepID=A0A179G4N3_METCM|nr:hypothetical protein VFPPC_15068 [Pochonia chlamydosporia 170]OAQ72109.1 hypothetical protein VFPPC_15068 [Pochonia chlamydosporia 170]
MLSGYLDAWQFQQLSQFSSLRGQEIHTLDFQPFNGFAIMLILECCRGSRDLWPKRKTDITPHGVFHPPLQKKRHGWHRYTLATIQRNDGPSLQRAQPNMWLMSKLQSVGSSTSQSHCLSLLAFTPHVPFESFVSYFS